MPASLHSAATRDLPAEVLYRILWLRSAVFVVEQQAAYDDIDGRDLEPTTVQFWAADGDDVLSTLRLLRDAHSLRIGRVATALAARGQGLSARLMQLALEACGDEPVVLDAQEHLAGWYERFGFAVSGPGFIEDDIPHVPMRRA